MSLFANLLSRLTFLNEAAPSPMERILPGFTKQARSLAATKGASSGTRENRLAMLTILYDLDIIDDSVIRQFKNDPSVSRMVDYFEANGIAQQIKNRKEDIQDYIKDHLENKISFTTGNRTDAAHQRYETNKLEAELKAAKKAAMKAGSHDVASAIDVIDSGLAEGLELAGSGQIQAAVEHVLDLFTTEVLDSERGKYDNSKILKAINNVRQYVEKHVTTVDQLKEVITRIFKMEEYSEIALHLSAALKAINLQQPTTDKINSEDEEGVSNRPGIGYEEEAEDESPSAINNKAEGDYTAEEIKQIVPGIRMKKYTGGQVPDFNKPNTITTEISVLNYMSEQRVYSSPKLVVESQSFREKFKPKTDKQLAELRSYGM